MANIKRLIDSHEEWLQSGLPLWCGVGGGLCNNIPDKYRKTFELFFPLDDDTPAGKDTIFWASEFRNIAKYSEMAAQYGPVRQTIVLFICAMHNEI